MKTYDLILQGHDATEDHAIALAMCGASLSESELTEQNITYKRYITTVNGIDIWYDFGADYYFFAPVCPQD